MRFEIYSIENRVLTVNDIEVNKAYRFNPFLLKGLLKTVFKAECNSFDSISGYINKENKVSQRNFLKFASNIEESKNGCKFIIDKSGTDILKRKLKIEG